MIKGRVKRALSLTFQAQMCNFLRFHIYINIKNIQAYMDINTIVNSVHTLVLTKYLCNIYPEQENYFKYLIYCFPVTSKETQLYWICLVTIMFTKTSLIISKISDTRRNN